MKYLLLALMALGASQAFADNSSGCGMGWKVTKSMTTSASSTRTTTNGTFSNTFGMTSGTSGCDYHSIVLQDKNKLHFMESNLIPMKYEVAVGSGERLDAFGMMMGCKQESLGQFKSVMKKNTPQIFGHNNSPYVIIEEMEKIISTDSSLGAGCLI